MTLEIQVLVWDRHKHVAGLKEKISISLTWVGKLLQVVFYVEV
jgi:hypothetical protein